MEIASDEGMLATVAQNISIGIVSIEEYVSQESLRMLSTSDAWITIAIRVVCLVERKEGRLIRPFLQIVE